MGERKPLSSVKLGLDKIEMPWQHFERLREEAEEELSLDGGVPWSEGWDET